MMMTKNFHFKLRPYQNDILSAVSKKVKQKSKKILTTAPTGAGKTIIAKELIRRALSKNNRVLFMCHRRNLVNQTFDKMQDFNPSVVMGNDKRYNADSLLQIGTMQTVKSRDIPTPKIIIIDEVHHGWKGNMMQDIITSFPDAFILGLTATPIDQKGYLLDGFDSVVDDVQMIDLINTGFLTPFKHIVAMKCNLKDVTVKNGDYVASELEAELNTSFHNTEILKSYIEYGENRKTIAFCINIKHAEELCELFSKQYNCGTIHSNIKDKERKKIYEDFDNNRIQILFNVDVLTAGFDQPDVSCILMAAPTLSLRKFIQQAGRGVRLSEGKKDCILIDCGNCIENCGLPEERRKYKFEHKISKEIDKMLDIDSNAEKRKQVLRELPQDRIDYYMRVGKQVDLYDGRQYNREQELQDDVNSFLKKTDFFNYRQNSGKAFMDGRWVHFASKAGLPDCAVYFRYGSIYIGVELKLPRGTLTKHQRKTLPEMIESGLLIFIAESVRDVFDIIEHVDKNVEKKDGSITIHESIYSLPEKQLKFRERLRLPVYKP